jgi:uncharacterized protein (TIGR03435 family)
MRTASATAASLIVSACFAGIADTAAQSSSAQAVPRPSPTFEIASVKVNKSGEVALSNQYTPSRMMFGNTPLIVLISYAYEVRLDLIVNGPDWITTDRFDVVGTFAATVPPATTRPPTADIRSMTQRLLEDRFALRVRRETQMLPVYLLEKANPEGRLGPGLRVSTVDCSSPAPGQRGPCANAVTGNSIKAVGTSWTGLRLAQTLRVDRPIVDRTGLTGSYDIELTWSPDPLAPSDAAPSLFTALQEQLGLKLVPAELPTDVLVVASVERPKPD